MINFKSYVLTESATYTINSPKNGYIGIDVAEKIARLIKDEFNAVAEKMNYKVDKGRSMLTGLSKDSFKGVIAFPAFYLETIIKEGNFNDIKREIKSNIGVVCSLGKNGDITFTGSIKDLGDSNITKMINSNEELNK